MHPISMYETYGQGAVGQEAATRSNGLNVLGVGAVDLRFNNPDGVPWDLSLPQHQRMAEDLTEERDTDWVAGAPPCTDRGVRN